RDGVGPVQRMAPLDERRARAVDPHEGLLKDVARLGALAGESQAESPQRRLHRSIERLERRLVAGRVAAHQLARLFVGHSEVLLRHSHRLSSGAGSGAIYAWSDGIDSPEIRSKSTAGDIESGVEGGH